MKRKNNNIEFETLHSNKHRIHLFIGVVCVVVLLVAIVLNFTQAKYKLTESIPLINGTINYKRPDLNVVAMYQQNESGEYVNIDTVPTSGYALNTELSVCGQSVDGKLVEDDTIPISYENGRVYIGINTKGTKCYLYFDVYKVSAGETILANKNIDTSRSGAITGVLTTNTTGTVYSVADDYGTSYVYAGAPTDNWVYFAGYYWRIIRINGDGSIRMIYNGTSTTTTGTSTQIQTSAYNSSRNDNAYVGYMYGSTGASSYSATHTNTNNSTIKGILDTWYENNIVEGTYNQYISTEQGFCNDRQIYTGASWSGYGTLGYGTNATWTYVKFLDTFLWTNC